MNESCHTYKRVMSRIEWVMSHVWMSHVAHMNESCHTYEWVMSRIWMSHVTHMNESCHTYEWVTPHIQMSHVTYVNGACHKCEEGMWHRYMSHVIHTDQALNFRKTPDERLGAGVETQKNVRGEVGGWSRVPFNEPYAPSLSTIYDGA